MFGLFKKKPATSGPDPRLLRLLEVYQGLEGQVEALYADVRHSPPELRFFAMSAISVYAQSYGQLPQREMEALITSFTEQALALLIARMPQASFELLHQAFADRFGEYAALIVEVSNAESENDLQQSTLALINVLDRRAKVERDLVDAIAPALGLVMPLTHCQADVRDAVVA